ncbi:MAG: class I SAM-dependent methyltransferase [Phycisphaerae bacterium]|jgi:SAM-dependent methyltransferase|nr:class I SAM-dependent methyltransferase [Phycisphaerae bacterium]
MNTIKATVSCLIAVLVFTAPAASGAETHQAEAKRIVKAVGFTGGLIVHVDCDDGELTAAFGAADNVLVHGLDTSADKIRVARKQIGDLGLYGKVSVEQLSSNRLSYADNLVNLLVSADLGDVGMKEVMRVLAPNGAAYIKTGGKWTKTVKPRPAAIDEWTHYLHSPSNNAVARDSVVGPPKQVQWICGPQWARSHDHLSTTSAMVSSGGRMFYILDEGPTAFAAVKPQWKLIARDAITGKLLSSTPIDGALPDVLSCDGESVFMRHIGFNMNAAAIKKSKPHLYSSAGFLDGQWWHRTYWQFGANMRSTWGGWPSTGQRVPSGRLLVLDKAVIYGFGRLKQYHLNGSHVGMGKTKYQLFACDQTPKRVGTGRRASSKVNVHWSRDIDIIVRAMVLTGPADNKTIFIAGPPNVLGVQPPKGIHPYTLKSPKALAEQAAAFEGQRGGSIRAISDDDGKTLNKIALTSPPVWDGMAVSDGRIYLATMDGQISCYGKK